MTQRIIKTNPCNYLPYQYDISIYIDANVKIFNYTLFMDEFNIFKNKDNYTIYCFKHPKRSTVLEECNAVVIGNLEKQENIFKMITEFDTNNFKDDIGLTETNYIMRKHKRITSFNEDWTKYIHTCIRDQISFDFLLFKHDIQFCRGTHTLKRQIITKKEHVNTSNRVII